MTGKRYEEIDFLRGIALVMMIVFHTVFDLSFFEIVPVDVSGGFWRYFAYATATLFLLIVGVSLTLSHARAIRKMTCWGIVKKYVVRGVGIFACGLLVTLVTWWYLGSGYVIFGILHLIGVAVMLSPLFFRFRIWNAVIGIVFIAAGWIFATLPGPMGLLVFGVHPATFWSVDYTPVFPWMGLVLIGMAIGDYLYPDGTRRFTLPALPEPAAAPVVFMGKHTLVIYLIHQPIILIFMSVALGLPLL
jgi:uncharacterized membrane protein